MTGRRREDSGTGLVAGTLMSTEYVEREIVGSFSGGEETIEKRRMKAVAVPI